MFSSKRVKGKKEDKKKVRKVERSNSNQNYNLSSSFLFISKWMDIYIQMRE